MVPSSKTNSSPPADTESINSPLSFEKVWLMFQETDKRFKETDKKFKETDKILTEKFQETDRLLTEKFQETDRILTEKFQETDNKFKETDKKLNKLEQLFTSQWGKLVESLVEGDVIKILNERGIEVTDTLRRRTGRRDGIDYEFDIIAINGTDIVIIEVKTTLRPGDVRDFLKKLKQAKNWMPEYSDKNIYGAMAFISEDAGTAAMAEKKGLFVIRATGDSASIINQENFQPKIW
ncbi:conserved hypothetical protein [Methanospirillum hungatei JF-1]|uniref:DUF3782 domain-containing protein n=1 Tax=Methanospirillum hungatei JF-1 (strain ATCC 27890 / DSM 864 / NBRC 100397 / JF-1) TaxID=323259 RepID=Q2FUJ1_METHJ|nr:hypothetical protein [Methanospirillum hungatei]ABD42814.1 conserved hypothetical protein [Methanospirillum hungatei JF-1]